MTLTATAAGHRRTGILFVVLAGFAAAAIAVALLVASVAGSSAPTSTVEAPAFQPGEPPIYDDDGLGLGRPYKDGER